jgi:hypothetical protein
MCFRLYKPIFTHHKTQILKQELQSFNWRFHGNRIPGNAIVWQTGCDNKEAAVQNCAEIR